MVAMGGDSPYEAPMHLRDPNDAPSPASGVVDRFLRLLMVGRLKAAAKLVTPDVVFLQRHGWHGEATPFRDDAQYQAGSLRQLPPEEVHAIPPEQQRAAFETVIGPNEYVFFAILRTPTSRATLGLIARETSDGHRVSRIFDTKAVKPVLLNH